MGNKMLLIVILLYQVIAITKCCPPVTTNCTLHYDNDIMNNAVVINSTQYCRVDECTVKLTGTGSLLNISPYNDEYYISCGQENVSSLLEIPIAEDNYCNEGHKDLSMMEKISDITGTLIILLFIILIVITIILMKLYTSLPVQLLLSANILWVICFFLVTVHKTTQYCFSISAKYCLFSVTLVSLTVISARIIEFQMILTIGYIFYSCKKCSTNQPALVHKKRILFMYLATAVGISILVNGIRVILLANDITNLSTAEGHCVRFKQMIEVDQTAECLYRAVLGLTTLASLVTFIFVAYLAYFLSKHNSIEIKEINRKLFKIVTIMISTSGLSLLVVIVDTNSFNTPSYLLACLLILCEKCLILYILVFRHKGN